MLLFFMQKLPQSAQTAVKTESFFAIHNFAAAERVKYEGHVTFCTVGLF